VNTLHFPAGTSEHPAPVVIGRGDIWLRPDGRTFLSIDSWHDSVFDQLAETIRGARRASSHLELEWR